MQRWLIEHLQAPGLYGYILLELVRGVPTRRVAFNKLFVQMEHVGVRSVWLVLVVGFFSGSIMAWQAAYQFQGVAPTSLLGGQTMRVTVMEIGPVLTALVIAGRIGASMAAELGAMQLTNQVAALRSLSISPIDFLVVPRVYALMFMLPFLIACSNLTAILGAYFVTSGFIGQSAEVYLDSIRQFFRYYDLFVGLFKGLIFGLLIGSIGCYLGLKEKRSSAAVGQSTIQAFVIAAIAILVADYLLWVIFF